MNIRFMKNGIQLTLLFVLIPIFSFAHGSHGSGFVAGFTHPILGLDHNLAILGIGLLGALINSSKWYIYLLAFLIPMAVGGYFGIGQEATFMVELIIAISVFIVGGLISFKWKEHKLVIISLLVIFGIFHGYAQGAEMPETTTMFKYISGYSIGAMVLFSLGFLVYKFIPSFKTSKTPLYLVGGILMLMGSYFIIEKFL